MNPDDALIAEKLFGWKWWHGQETYDHGEVQDEVIGNYSMLMNESRHDEWSARFGLSDERYASENRLASCLPAYTTDPAADYSVLVKVRETWCDWQEANKPENSRMCDDGRCHPTNYRRCRSWFFSELRRMWEERDSQLGWIETIGRYQPGDYSRAALAVLKEQG